MCEDFLKLELKDWQEIAEILKFHEKNIERSKVLLFKNPSEDDCDAVLKSNGNEQPEANIEYIDGLSEEKEEFPLEKKHSDEVLSQPRRDSNFQKKHSDQTAHKDRKINDSSFENECKII